MELASAATGRHYSQRAVLRAFEYADALEPWPLTPDP